MENLKLKIFDVLTNKISISDYENWLYTDPEILNAIETNDLVYKIICLNYK